MSMEQQQVCHAVSSSLLPRPRELLLATLSCASLLKYQISGFVSTYICASVYIYHLLVGLTSGASPLSFYLQLFLSSAEHRFLLTLAIILDRLICTSTLLAVAQVFNDEGLQVITPTVSHMSV